MDIRSSTSNVSPKACSRLLASVTCPIESQAETSLGTVSMVMVFGSTSNADLNAVRTLPNNSSVLRFPIALSLSTKQVQNRTQIGIELPTLYFSPHGQRSSSKGQAPLAIETRQEGVPGIKQF